jgi:hypothetical protein
VEFVKTVEPSHVVKFTTNMMSFILRKKINHGSFGPFDDETQARDERVGPYATIAMDHVVLVVVVNDGVAIERSIQLGNCRSIPI